MEPTKLSGHDHTLTFVKNHVGLECDACDRSYCKGFSCSECKFTVHDECIFLFGMTVLFDHPSHHGHSIGLLTTGAPDHTDSKCHICGKNTKRLLYHCSICELNLDIDCIVDVLCAQANLNKFWHHHPLLEIVFGNFMSCEICLSGGALATFALVVSCLFIRNAPLNLSQERSLTLVMSDTLLSFSSTELQVTQIRNVVYVDVTLGIFFIIAIFVHEHTVTLMPRLITFVCDACGTKGDRTPYVCLQCDFMIHQECARLPRVIHVNRHDHRVSYKYPLGRGEWKCGVCWEEIDWSCGAYLCSRCPNYAVHSKCAMRYDVWDGIELDGVPEKVEDIEPFVVNDDNTVTHFAHKHNLSLNEVGVACEESIFCRACVRPIGFNSFYKCSNCDFILHERCANLPKLKRHFFSPRQLHLQPNTIGLQKCDACSRHCCTGFMYADYLQKFDLQCSLITEPFLHGSHPHPLFYMEEDYYGLKLKKICQICGIRTKNVMGCNKCNFFLDFRCATLPLTVRLHRYDDHLLTLCYGEKASGKYWCDICEKETDPETWFYTCKYCGVTLHIFCVVGDLKYAKPGEKITDEVELLSNNTSSRPLCNNCLCRCSGPFVLKDNKRTNTFFCSYHCFKSV